MPADSPFRPSDAPAPAAPPFSRRRLLSLASWGLLPLAAAILAGCDKPYYDRNRGVFVFPRHEK